MRFCVFVCLVFLYTMSKATVCVAFSAPSQLRDVVDRDVSPLLARARRENLEPEVVFVGGGSIGSFENTEYLTTLVSELDKLEATGSVKPTLISSFTDLPMLRFFPSIGLGEVCRVEDATLEELVEVLRRVPAIKNIDDVPSAMYSDHVRDCNASAQYFLALVKSEPDVDLKPLFTMAMYAKMVSLAWKTANVPMARVRSIIESVPNAEALGLMKMLPLDEFAPNIISFVECCLVDEERQPGQVDAAAAAAAATALETVFAHAERVHAVLGRSKLATLLHDHAPLVDAGPRDAFLKIVYARKVEGVKATGAGLELKTSISKSWLDNINADLQSVLSALKQESAGENARAFRAVAKKVAPKLAYLTSISSSLFTIDSAMLAASLSDVLLANKRFSVVAHTQTRAAHVVKQLQIGECGIDVNACVLHVGKHPSSEASVFGIFPVQDTAPASQRQSFLDPIVNGGAAVAHKQLQQAASVLDGATSPIGSLQGVVTGTFEFDGATKRGVLWRRRGGSEVAFSIHDARMLELKFIDYHSGSVDGTSVGLNKVRRDFDIFSSTRLKLGTLDPVAGVFGFQKDRGTAVEFELRETLDDNLSGLHVQWARRGDAWLLVSDNAINERLVV